MLCPGDSFASDLLVAVKMLVAHPLVMGASWEPEGGHGQLSTGAALLGEAALLLHPEEPENCDSRSKPSSIASLCS